MDVDAARMERRIESYSRHGLDAPAFRESIDDSPGGGHCRGSAIEMEPKLAREFADWALKEFKYQPLGHEDRPVYIQPYPGHHGLAGYVVTINGSPVRATVLVMLGMPLGRQILMTRDGKRFLRGSVQEQGASLRRYEAVIAFLERAGVPLDTNHDLQTIAPSE
jgi:hypothetical protein